MKKSFGYKKTGKSKPRETLENELKKQLDTFSVHSAIKLKGEFLEEPKWLLAVSSSVVYISVFEKSDRNNNFFQFFISLLWTSRNWNFWKTEEIWERGTKNDIEMLVKWFAKRGFQTKTKEFTYQVQTIDDKNLRNEIREPLRKNKFNSLVGMFCRQT